MIDRHVKYLFPLPALIMMGVIVAFPIGYNLVLSLHRWNLAGGGSLSFVGFENYLALAQDERFWNSLRVTALFTFGALGGQVILGTALALFFHRSFRGKAVVKAIFLFPIAATPVAVSLIWAMMYNYDLGIINHMLTMIGLPRSLWLASPNMVIPALIITDIWQWTPLIMLIVLASLESLPTDPFESALVDGASSFQTLIYLTLPMVRPAIVVAAMIRSIDAIKTFDLIYVMTQGGPDIASENLNIYIFQKGFSYFRMGEASTLAVVLFTLVLVFNLLLALLRNAGDTDVRNAGA